MAGAPPPRPTCRACGTTVDPLEPSPWTCPRRGTDGADHVLVVPSPDADHLGGHPDDGLGDDPNPFVRYRHRLASYRAAIGGGVVDDRAFVDLVHRIDDAVAAIDGTGFVVTPIRSFAELDAATATAVVVKDETGNVSGSHKGRHLMGLALWLAVREAAGADPVDDPAPLAIASCGNAALAAATVAAAIRRPLEVFVPTWADPTVLDRLSRLGGRVHSCVRRPEVAGDPCVAAARAAVAAGAVPFGCTGPDNGLTIDGGRTIGWELADQLAARADHGVDRVFVQVGGGALGTSLGDGLLDGSATGAAPALVAVQTEGCAPFARALARVRAVGLDGAVADRAATMWPWESEPHSSATGILDDETYDWAGLAAVVQATGGDADVVDESAVVAAHALAHQATDIDADPTGTAGLAGLLRRPGGTAVVLFTGATRR